MTKQIDTTAENNGLRLVTQGAHPSSPSSGHVIFYHVTGTSSPGIFIEDSSGRKIGPFITGTPPPPSITPTDISGCINWIDLNQESGVDGDAIGTLTDRSSSANNCTQGTAANKPTLRLNVANGKRGAYFDGSNDYLTFGTNIDLPTTHTILIVAAPMVKLAYSPLLQYKQQGMYQSIAGAGYWGIYRSGDGIADWIEGGQPQVFGLWGNSNSDYEFIHNYLRKTGTNTNAFTAAATSYLGTDIISTGAQVFAGYILESIIYNVKISEANLYALIDSLLYKWRGLVRS